MQKTTQEDQRAAYSMREVAQKLGVAQTHIGNMVRAGEIPSKKLGRRILIPRWWVDQIGKGPADA